jgi:hypothetical protein
MLESITVASGTTGTAVRPRADHRLALLTARTGLEPELAQRYSEDPLSILAEFGLTATEPVYLEDRFSDQDAFVLEDFDRVGATVTSSCNFTHGPIPVTSSCNFTHGPIPVTSSCNFTHGPIPAGRS